MKRLICCALVACFCFVTPGVFAKTTCTAPVAKNVSVGAFSELEVKNPLNVTIMTGLVTASTPSFQILGRDSSSVSAVTWTLHNHRLSLATKWNYWPRQSDRLTVRINVLPSQLNQIRFISNGCLVGNGLTGPLTLITKGSGCVKLYTNQLNLKSLIVQGKSNITVRHIKSTSLVVEGSNDGEIKLDGVVALQSIRLTGNGSLRIHWVDTPYLKINAAGTEKIFLAGLARSVDAQLTTGAQLCAKQLQIRNGFIATRTQARAEVTVRDRLDALAEDKSVIYYFPGVAFVNTYTRSEGIVLPY